MRTRTTTSSFPGTGSRDIRDSDIPVEVHPENETRKQEKQSLGKSARKRRIFDREFKLSAVGRLIAGESATQIAQELQVGSSHLSKWWANYRRYGAEGLRRAHRPRKMDAARLEPTAAAAVLAVAQQRIRELEQKVGQQQLELDFFHNALRQVGTAGQASEASGLSTSTP